MKNNKNIYVYVVILALGILDVCRCDWCMVSTVPSNEELQKFIDYGCSQYDCSPISPGGACFYPNIMQAHAAWILDKFYKERGICKAGLGYRTNVNPCN